MKKSRLFTLVCTVLMLVLPLVPSLECDSKESKEQITNDPRVLFLMSYNYDWESVPLQLAGLTETMRTCDNIDYSNFALVNSIELPIIRLIVSF